MHTPTRSILSMALAAAFALPAQAQTQTQAQSSDELLKELRALKGRVTELEQKLQDKQRGIL